MFWYVVVFTLDTVQSFQDPPKNAAIGEKSHLSGSTANENQRVGVPNPKPVTAAVTAS